MLTKNLYNTLKEREKAQKQIITFVNVKKQEQRMFFLWILHSFYVDRYVLQLFYKFVLQIILSFGLICVFGNMRKQDQDRLQRRIRRSSRIIGCDQMSAAQLRKDLIWSTADCILIDPTHPLHKRFQLRRIRAARFSESFVPSAIRLLVVFCSGLCGMVILMQSL